MKAKQTKQVVVVFAAVGGEKTPGTGALHAEARDFLEQNPHEQSFYLDNGNVQARKYVLFRERNQPLLQQDKEIFSLAARGLLLDSDAFTTKETEHGYFLVSFI